MEKDKKLFLETAGRWKLPVNGARLETLETLARETLSQNKKFNLISKKDSSKIWTRHILDSLAFFKFAGELDYSEKSLFADAGTGAGFPGICLKIFLPGNPFVFWEPNLKKNRFLLWMFVKLSLKNAEAFPAPLGEGEFEKVDILTERAMGQLENILEPCLNMIKKETGVFCAWQSNDKIVYSEKIQKIMKKKNAEIFKIFRYNLPYEEKNRFIITFRRKKCIS